MRKYNFDPEAYETHAKELGFTNVYVDGSAQSCGYAAVHVHGKLTDPDGGDEAFILLNIMIPTSPDFDRYYNRPEVVFEVNLRYPDSKLGPDWRIFKMRLDQFLNLTRKDVGNIVFMLDGTRDTLARIDIKLKQLKESRKARGVEMKEQWKEFLPK